MISQNNNDGIVSTNNNSRVFKSEFKNFELILADGTNFIVHIFIILRIKK